jgi:multiple inositol-polyphosphate phosphatase/2,3-bisphosphoglycerate 3-phosphatase
MKHRLLYLSVLSSFIYAGTAKAQIDCTNQYWGSQTNYSVPVIPLTPTPAEYIPVFINYVGRHGDANLLKDVSTTFTYKILQKADSAKALKDDGKKLRQMLLLIQGVEKAKLGTLSASGIDAMTNLGIRMLGTYPTAFKPNSCIKVSAFNEPRILQSAAALLKGMGRSIDAPGCDKVNLKDDDNLQPFAVSPALKTFAEKGDWKDISDDYRETKKPKNFNTRFLSRFFVTDFLESLDDDAQNKFIADMYNLGLANSAIVSEVIAAGLTFDQVNIRSFFTCSELEVFYNANNTGEFYKSAAGNDKQGLQVRSAVPLLINLMNTTDAYSIGDAVAADVRLTTAEPIASLATLLNFKGYSQMSKNDYKVSNVWKAEEVIPLAANIQMIFYRGTSADTRSYFLVKFLLNEKEMEIDGLRSRVGTYYYLWDDVKAFYTKKLNEELDVEKLNADMHSYLLKLK